ncbi:GRP family sugar transporter [Spirosoma utsteinense]|uniref:Glucose uptake protein n=1 Tax=Spirosoma utsteinense TaxID=2585773 RepID=A0ABR6WFM0_9BACT|nr:GRP family sugar transporter [Spirosoma utsteinense]MBC3788774.1 glucose uptake protein [Spirosoma utsteinense]MBC3794727.1 glucose uptake protein [Spirosoma utsteinense]
MFITTQPGVAIALCLVTMVFWGSWANAQKIVTKTAPLHVFYRDYVYGILLAALAIAFTLGSFGEKGRSVFADIQQADMRSILLALAGGIVFNTGNILLTVGISMAGISIAMPVGTGLSLAIGLVANYLAEPEGSIPLLATGGGMVLLAMLFSSLAYRTKQEQEDSEASSDNNRGIWIALAGGAVAGFFFLITSTSLVTDLTNPEAGLLTPYTGLVLFALGVNLSNPLLERLVRRFILTDSDKQLTYRRTPLREHLVGIAGGLIWGIGLICLLLGANQAGDAVSYGLSQGATVVSVLWGLFIWREFEGAPGRANRYLWLMGIAYCLGLVLIVLARA